MKRPSSSFSSLTLRLPDTGDCNQRFGLVTVDLVAVNGVPLFIRLTSNAVQQPGFTPAALLRSCCAPCWPRRPPPLLPKRLFRIITTVFEAAAFKAIVPAPFAEAGTIALEAAGATHARTDHGPAARQPGSAGEVVEAGHQRAGIELRAGGSQLLAQHTRPVASSTSPRTRGAGSTVRLELVVQGLG